MKTINLLFLFVLCSIGLISCQKSDSGQSISIIPQPTSLQTAQGHFTLTAKTPLNIVKGADDLEPACKFFSELVAPSLGSPLLTEQGETKTDAINIYIDTTLAKEAYTLHVTSKAIDIKAGSSSAVFYAFQTLRQMMPVSIEKGEKQPAIEIPDVTIQDQPRFAYRGLMLDVCRHIFSPDEIKTYIDMLAMHKMNRFHWHLTDDQGWRIEIKKYPELTKIGSMRKETVIGRNSGKYDGQPYGGFYTQEDIKEIVQYAADRYITVIPEIELPGHASAALASYPELGCTGGPYKVVGEWGVFDDVFCAGNDKTFEFFQDVFDEIIPLFPSEYIHVGGDECPKTAWKKCPKCQKRIKKEGLKNEHELQSYFIHRIENYLNSKGKKIIGWDEILEGGISKTATVMSWRGTKGGIEAAQKGNQVIMTPNTYVYLDYYQSLDTKNEPFAIGGYVPVEKVYSLEPTEGLTPEEGNMIVGVQGNLWTEYIPNFSQVQYMVLPRMAAIAEIGWTPANLKNYEDFVGRTITLMERYDALGYNYAKHIMSVSGKTSFDEEKSCIRLTLAPNYQQAAIHYTVDGSVPTLQSPVYKEPLDITSDCDIRAQLFRNGKAIGKEFNQSFKISQAVKKKAQLQNKISEVYAAQGSRTLTDGIRGTVDFRDGNWVGTCNDDMILVVDFEQPTTYSKVNVGCLNKVGDWICLPVTIRVYASENGNDYTQVAEIKDIADREEFKEEGIHNITLNIENGKSRFVKVVVERQKFLPEDHPGAGNAAYVFLDEIEID